MFTAVRGFPLTKVKDAAVLRSLLFDSAYQHVVNISEGIQVNNTQYLTTNESQIFNTLYISILKFLNLQKTWKSVVFHTRELKSVNFISRVNADLISYPFTLSHDLLNMRYQVKPGMGIT